MSRPVSTPVVDADERWPRARVTAIEPHPTHTVVLAGGSGSPVTVTVACRPDVEAARRQVRSVRRIDQVELTIAGERCRASVRGTRHRLPFETAVPTAVGLGLAAIGVRTVIQQATG